MSTKRTIWRWTKRCFRWGGLLLLVLITVVVGVNFYNPPLSQESIAYLTRPVNDVPDTENLYLALEGFEAPEGQSLTDFGRARQAFDDESSSRLMAGHYDADEDKKRPAGIPHRSTAHCRLVGLWAGAADALQIDHPTETDKLLDQRYIELLKYSRYADIEVDAFASMAAYPPSGVRCLFVARAIAAMQSDDLGSEEEGTLQLLLDIRMLRIILANSDDLFAKRVAARLLVYDWSYLGIALASEQHVLDVSRPGIVEPWTEPSDWNMARPYARYLRQMQNFLSSMPAAATSVLDPLAIHFIKKDATLNMLVESHHHLGDALMGNGRDLQADIDQQKKWISEHDFGWNFRSAYNPIGRQLLVDDWLIYDTLMVLQDCRAFEQLLRLSYAIHDQNISAADVSAFMEQHPEWGVHPMSGKKFVFDPSSSTISFEPVSHEEHPIQSSLRIWESPGGSR